MKVYSLQHRYKYEIYEGIETTNAKFIGVYSSRQKAQEAIERFRVKQGFERFPVSCFFINEHTLNENHWLEGFITLKKENGRKKYDIPKKLKTEKALKEFDTKTEQQDLTEVYYLEHYYEYKIMDLDIKIDTVKFIGVYRSEEEAKSIKEQIKAKSGYRQYTEDCFYIDRYYLDKDDKGWTEGFITWDSETDSWIE